jgi:hypothetical protein
MAKLKIYKNFPDFVNDFENIDGHNGICSRQILWTMSAMLIQQEKVVRYFTPVEQKQ